MGTVIFEVVWLGGRVVVREPDLRSIGRGFESWPGKLFTHMFLCYQAV